MPHVVLGQPQLLGVSYAHTIIGASWSVGSTVSYLFLVDNFSATQTRSP